MLMRCNFKTILRGDVVKPGTVLDLTAEECALDVIKKSFTHVGNGTGAKAPAAADSAAKDAVVVAGLTREQAIIKLQHSGAKFKANISNKALAALYEQTFSNVGEISGSGAAADASLTNGGEEDFSLGDR